MSHDFGDGVTTDVCVPNSSSLTVTWTVFDAVGNASVEDYTVNVVAAAGAALNLDLEPLDAGRY